LCFQDDRLQEVKWRQWKAHLFQQDHMHSTWSPHAKSRLYNLEWDLREEHQIGFPHGWVVYPMAAAVGAFVKTLMIEPAIRPGTPDPYAAPKSGEPRPGDHLQIGPIAPYVAALVRAGELPQPHHGGDPAPG